MTPGVASFLYGLLIGGGAALVGAVLSYWFGLRRSEAPSAAPLSYLLVTALLLGAAGVGALLLAILGAGSLRNTVMTGLGVGTGFLIGFAGLVFGWLALSSRGD